MKVTSILFLAVAAIVSAQDLPGVDPCVGKCIRDALATVGCTGTIEQITACGCKADIKQKLLVPVINCASAAKCSTAAIIQAQAITDKQCQALAGGH
ncbi:hypothetical protein TWF694_000219 [Orbilia ellipsospora]|uniref:Extracellular membrane protein CFEM domain-containing protein n=1 Tax=Orbilia ellipsospora TaxID=2528407 RepID=A0AAV9XN02_9PEZI